VILDVEGVCVERDGAFLVEDFRLRLDAGQVHAVVGESGSGKTRSALAVMGLLPEGLVATVRFSPSVPRPSMAMVLQDPAQALNPVMSVGSQLGETLAVHGQKTETRRHALRLLQDVGLNDGPALWSRFPHQLSVGQCQRVAIACALAAAPRVLIVDEPTSALDGLTRSAVLKLLKGLATDRGLAVWLISHELSAVRDFIGAITVMYAGRVVESGVAASIFMSPRHPYTAALLALDPARVPVGQPLPFIAGAMPKAAEAMAGCRFHPRCPRAAARCRVERPVSSPVACFFPLGEP
jgi:oligopeptide/dipeptide ABC transporter ATP-binding protein